MNIQPKINSETGEVVFYYQPETASRSEAEMIAKERGEDALIIDHTYVDPTLRGQGIADKLMQAAADYARGQKRKIIPRCSYARRKMEKESRYQDLW
mgnify:CR=1 FL=1